MPKLAVEQKTIQIQASWSRQAPRKPVVSPSASTALLIDHGEQGGSGIEAFLLGKGFGWTPAGQE